MHEEAARGADNGRVYPASFFPLAASAEQTTVQNSRNLLYMCSALSEAEHNRDSVVVNVFREANRCVCARARES